MKAALILFLAGLLGNLVAGEMLVADAESARKAVLAAQPGDVIILKAGEWKDIDMRLDGEGADGNPITIRAEVPGATVITGASRVRLGGLHLVVSGLWLKNITGSKADWFEFRIDSKRRANHCRVTDCAFTEEASFKPKDKENRWVGFYGQDNQIDHCLIEGKKTKGASLVVWLGDDNTGSHRLLQNYFGERPALGRNGGETVRIGDSKSSMLTASCLVEGNIFYRCDGETECISNKSCGNTYRGNLFREVQGTLTLRHGNGCLVEGNVFLGGKRERTGGIRVIGEDHRVIGNHLEDLEGDGFRSAIALLNGVPDSPENGYFQVKRALIRCNTMIHCNEGILLGYNDVDEATLPPLLTRFEENRILSGSGQTAVRAGLEAIETVWEDNVFEGELAGLEVNPGLTRGEVTGTRVPALSAENEVGVTWKQKP